MMAVGMRRWQLLVQFLLEAAFVGLLGGMAGALAGSLVVYWYGHYGMVFRVPGSGTNITIRPFITALYILRTFALAAGGAALAALYPAFLASRLRPIEALSRS
jgi:putative ABC transport system permease protein